MSIGLCDTVIPNRAKRIKESTHNRWIIRWLCIFIGFIACNVTAEITTEDFTLSVDTYQHNNVRVDEIDKVINSQQFVPLEPEKMSANGSPWLKIEWDKSKVTNETFIINDFTSQAYEDYYFIKDNQVIATHSGGYTDRFDSRPIKHFKFVAKVYDADYILLKTCCNPKLPIYFRLLNEKELNEDYYHYLIRYAVIYACITLLVIYNFFIFLYLKEKQYLFYCYYLCSMIIISLTLSGIGKQFFWPNLKQIEFFYFIASINVSIASIVFVRAFLTQKILSRFHIRLIDFIIVLHVIVAFSYLLTPYVRDMERINNLMVQTVTIASWLITDYVIIRSLIKGDRSARVLFFSYALINLAGLTLLLRYNGKIPDIPWTNFFVDIVVLLESIILSLALAQKIQKLREEKSLAEQKQFQEQKRFSRQLLQVQEVEKKQLGSALHDNFTHQLLILKNLLMNKERNKNKEIDHVNKILNEMRDLSHILHPYLLETLGLQEALNDMIDRLSESYDLDIHFIMQNVTLDKEQALIVYRIIQELLNNIIKHAHASESIISVAKKDTQIELLVKDNGRGFDTATKKGLGLTTIKERTQMLNGKMQINSSEDGASILITFPQVTQ